ncbi:MAG: hypothetical protein R6X35_08740 [Candidatus Krumholzibacteriia bacterium]
MRVSVLLAALLLAVPALAQLDPDDDGIGIYFDPSAAGANCVPMEPGAQRCFLVITHPTSQQAGVGGWEAKIWMEGPGLITGISYEGDTFNFASRPFEYIVGIATPLYNPWLYPSVVVAIFDFFVLEDTEPIYWYIDGVYFHSMPDKVPAYLDGDDYNIIIALQQPTGGPEIPVASINSDDCAVPIEPVTWGGMKALFK